MTIKDTITIVLPEITKKIIETASKRKQQLYYNTLGPFRYLLNFQKVKL